MTVAEYGELSDRVVTALLENPGRALVWGVSPTSLELLRRLRDLGLADAVAGVVDHRSGRHGMRIADWTVARPTEVAAWNVDYLIIGLDAEKETVLREFTTHSDGRPDIIAFGVEHYEFRDNLFSELVDSTYVNSRTGGYRDVLTHVFQSLRYITERRLQGDVAEFGVYKAGTTIFMARALKRLGSAAMVYGFDTFAGFPERRHTLDTYSCPDDEFDDLNVIRANCQLYENINLVRGNISETYRELADKRLALSFFDTDNYSATRAALPMCAELTVPGGIICFDHYYSPDWPAPMGERMAAQEVLDTDKWLNLHATGVFIKI